jgi:hypothetical protein
VVGEHLPVVAAPLSQEAVVKQPFDPFDPKHQNKRARRRSSAEMRSDRIARVKSIDEDFKRGLQELEDQGFSTDRVLACLVLTMAVCGGVRASNSPETLRMNMEKSMARLGYAKDINPKSKDGRWCVNGQNTFVYVKSGGTK